MNPVPAYRFLESVSDRLDDVDIRRLKERIEFDHAVLSVRTELRVLIATGVTLFSSGVALLIEHVIEDLDQVLIFGPMLAAAALLLYAAPPYSRRIKDTEAPLRFTICLNLGFALTGAAAAALQLLNGWDNATNLWMSALFLVFAMSCNSRAAIAWSATGLAAFIGAHQVPMNWTIFELLVDSGRSWVYVSILALTALLFGFGRHYLPFSRTLLDIAVPIALVTEIVNVFDSVDSDELAYGILRFSILVAVAIVAFATSHILRMTRLAVQAVVGLLIGFMSLVSMLVDDMAVFSLILLVASVVSMLFATSFVQKIPKGETD